MPKKNQKYTPEEIKQNRRNFAAIAPIAIIVAIIWIIILMMFL